MLKRTAQIKGAYKQKGTEIRGRVIYGAKNIATTSLYKHCDVIDLMCTRKRLDRRICVHMNRWQKQPRDLR